MALSFDIDGTPPAAAEIAGARVRIERERAALEKKATRFTVAAIAGGLAIVCFQLFIAAPAVGEDSTDPTIVGVVALYTPYILGAFFFTTLTFYLKRIDQPRRDLALALAALNEVTPDELVTGLDAEHGEIAAYHAKVRAQGRALVHGELEAMRRWRAARRPAE